MTLSSPRVLFSCLLMLNLVVGVLVYGQVIHHQFLVWDDLSAVVNNPRLHGLTRENLWWLLSSPAEGIWMPVTYLSFLLEFQWDLAMGTHLLVNPLIHVVNATLVGLLVFRITGVYIHGTAEQKSPMDIAAGFIASLIFLVHPVNVESAVWFSARKEVLCGFFYLIAVYSWINARQHPDESVFWKRCAWVAQLAALLSKPMAVTIPAAFLLVDYVFDKNIGRKHFLDKWPYWLASMAMIPIAIWCQFVVGALPGTGDVPLLVRFAQGMDGYIFYLSKFLAPTGLFPYYPSFAEIGVQDVSLVLNVLAVFLVIGIAGYDYVYGKRQWFVAILWYLVVFFPVVGWMQVGTHRIADRYAYLPMVSLVGTASFILARWWVKHNLLGSVFILGLLVSLAGLSYRQVGIWENERRLWEYTVTYQQQPATLPLSNLAGVYMQEGQQDKGILLRKKIIALNPGKKIRVIMLIDECALAQNWKCALEGSELGIQQYPDDIRFVIKAGDFALFLKQVELARHYYQQALQANPHNVSLLWKLALLESDQQHTREALGYLDALLAVDPVHADALQLKARLQHAKSLPVTHSVMPARQ